MAKWEYRHFQIEFSGGHAPLHDGLNELGEGGWEVFHFERIHGFFIAYLKREKIEKPPEPTPTITKVGDLRWDNQPALDD